MPAKLDVPALIIKAKGLFETSKGIMVFSEEAKKECDKAIAEVGEALAEAEKAVASKEATPAEIKEVKRAIDKLSISRNYLLKSVGAFNQAEDARKAVADRLKKERADKIAMIEARKKEKQGAIAAATK